MKYFSFLSALVFVIAGCTNGQRMNDAERFNSYDQDEHTKAIATLMPLGDRNISGSVTFEAAEGGVKVTGSFEGLEEGKHGFHIHEFGDCSASDGSSAGGHFAPANSEHSSPTAENRHMGDMGNLNAVAGQTTTIEYVDEVIDIRSIIGRGVVIHAGEDDLESQPSGDSGDRIACGVIGIAQAEEE